MNLTSLNLMPPITAVSPFHQALQSGLENYMNMTKAAYTPATMQADIASKQAYANYLPYQNISTALSNPLTLAMMSKDQRELMFNALGQMAENLKNTGQSSNQTGISSLWDNLKNWATKSIGNNTPQSNISDYIKNHPEAAEGMKSPNGYVIPNNNTEPTKNSPSNYPTTDDQVDFDTSSPSANALGIDTGTPEGNRALAKSMPSPALQNEIAASKQRKVSSAKTQVKTSQDIKTNAFHEGQAALRLSQFADTFDEGYQNAFIKGWKAQLLPERFAKLDPNSATAMNAANNMIGDVEQQLFGNKPSDFRTKLAGSTKLEIGMPEKTEKTILGKIKSMSARAMQHSDFDDYAEKLGIKDPNQRNRIWFDYNKNVPFYDVKSHKILRENLTDESYKKYIENNIPNRNIKKTNSSGVLTIEHEGKKYMHINGKWMVV